MKANVIVVILVFTVAAVLLSLATDWADTGQTTKTPVQLLPASLDKFYPPKTENPEYLLAMRKMAEPFAGMLSDLLENDMQNASENFKEFNFSPNALIIFFQRYQVAPGTVGSIIVTLSKSTLEENSLKSDYLK